jgi:hypothetical protein
VTTPAAPEREARPLTGEEGAGEGLRAPRLAPDPSLRRPRLTPMSSSASAPSREGALRTESSSAAPWSGEARRRRREQRGLREEER